MIAASIMIFLAVFLTVLAVFMAITAIRHSPAAELRRRLRRMEEGNRTSENNVAGLLTSTSPIEDKVFRLPLLSNFKRLIIHSGVQSPPLRFLALTMIACLFIFSVVYAFRGNAIAALLTASLVVLVPIAYLQFRKQRRQDRFHELLPDALVMIARSLRAGHSLTGAIELISLELPEPVGGLFKIAYDQQKLGIRLAEALMALPERIESTDLQFFTTIVRINSETGGNLAEILEKLADTIRSRLQIRKQVQVYTAEGRLSGYVLVLLPVVVFIVFYLKNPEYMRVFFTEPVCKLSLGAAVLAQLGGFIMIRQIVNIRI